MPRAKKSDSVSTVSTEKVETIKKPKLKKTQPKAEPIEDTIKNAMALSSLASPNDGAIRTAKVARVLTPCAGKTKRGESCKRIVREGSTNCSLHLTQSA